MPLSGDKSRLRRLSEGRIFAGHRRASRWANTARSACYTCFSLAAFGLTGLLGLVRCSIGPAK
eukprot:4659656-Pyramimonas_sp.AAC.1